MKRLERSDRATEHIRILAQRHPHTKFVSIVGDKCIPNLPDARLPMLIIYRKGEVVNQIVAWGGDRERRIEGKLECFVCMHAFPGSLWFSLCTVAVD